MYDYAVQLIESGQAYVDDLSADEIREHRGTPTEVGKESPFPGHADRARQVEGRPRGEGDEIDALTIIGLREVEREHRNPRGRRVVGEAVYAEPAEVLAGDVLI